MMQSTSLSGGVAGTVETIAKIRELIEQGKKDPVVNRKACKIARTTPAFNPVAEAMAVYRWVLKNVRFTRDIQGCETVRSARETLTVLAGDCDCQVVLICSLLSSIGHKMQVVTVASHPSVPDQFSHIYARDFLGGRWVALDTARRNPAFGKEPELSRIFRKREWNLQTADYTDVKGLMALAAMAEGHAPQLGLGQGDEDYAGIASIITAGTVGASNIIRATSGLPSISPTGQIIAGSGATSIPAGYSLVNGQLVLTSSLTAGTLSSSSLLLLGGLGLALLLVMRE